LFEMSVFVHFHHTYRNTSTKLDISLSNFIKTIKIEDRLEEHVARQEQIGGGETHVEI
jgi:hypothetical protein